MSSRSKTHAWLMVVVATVFIVTVLALGGCAVQAPPPSSTDPPPSQRAMPIDQVIYNSGPVQDKLAQVRIERGTKQRTYDFTELPQGVAVASNVHSFADPYEGDSKEVWDYSSFAAHLDFVEIPATALALGGSESYSNPVPSVCVAGPQPNDPNRRLEFTFTAADGSSLPGSVDLESDKVCDALLLDMQNTVANGANDARRVRLSRADGSSKYQLRMCLCIDGPCAVCEPLP